MFVGFLSVNKLYKFIYIGLYFTVKFLFFFFCFISSFSFLFCCCLSFLFIFHRFFLSNLFPFFLLFFRFSYFDIGRSSWYNKQMYLSISQSSMVLWYSTKVTLDCLPTVSFLPFPFHLSLLPYFVVFSIPSSFFYVFSFQPLFFFYYLSYFQSRLYRMKHWRCWKWLVINIIYLSNISLFFSVIMSR